MEDIRSPSSPPAGLPPLEPLPFEVLHEGRCHLGEGPTYDGPSDTAWWFDILGKRLYEARVATREVRTHILPVMASALAMVDNHTQLVVAEDGLYCRSTSNGTLVPHRPLPAGDVLTRSNDARVHPAGTLWFSTMGRGAETGAGAIHALYRGEIRTLFSNITIPNAICFSPCGTLGFFADTRLNMMMRVELNPVTGLPSADPMPFLRHTGLGGLDGAVTDAEGTIWCAHWGGGCVTAYRRSGEVVRRIIVPAQQPSCPVFVGPGFGTLLVTSAFEGMDQAARASDAQHGRTFLIPLGIMGKAEPRVAL